MSTTEIIIKIEVKPLYSANGSSTIPSGYVVVKTVRK